MTDLTTRFLSRLTSHTISGVELFDGAIYPKYEDQSILNIPSTICKWMNLPGLSTNPLNQDIISPLEGEVKRVILILLDGLQFDRFIRWSQFTPIWNSLLKDGVLVPITSVVPSTTSSALTTLWTGVSPASHGIIGYEMWLKEYSLVANMITHSPMTFKGSTDSLELAGFSPDSFLGFPTLGSHLHNNGVKTYSFTHYAIAHSGLSRMLMEDVDIHPFQTPASMWVSLRQLIEQKSEEKMYVWTYWGQLDGISHYHGPDDERVSAEFSHFSAAFEKFFLNTLRPDLKKGTIIILTADHGQTHTPLNPNQVLSNHPSLNKHLRINPTCENRFAFLHLRPGSEAAVRSYFDDTWPGRFTLISQNEALDNHLFGPGPEHHDLRVRIGDLIAVANDGAYLWWSDKQVFLIGRHGGMNPQDMLVPFMAFRL